MSRTAEPKKENLRQLPCNIDAERFILGTILLDDSRYSSVVGAITRDVFSLEKHRTIWQRMGELAERSEVIDRVTVANELLRYDELDAVGGLSYLVSLDDQLPRISNIEAYVRAVVEKYRLRKAIYTAQRIANQAFSAEYTADEVELNGQAMLAEESGGFGSSQLETTGEFIQTYPGGVNRFLDPVNGDPGILTGLTELDEITGGFHAGEIFMVGARPSHGKTMMGSCIAKNVAREGKRVAVFTLELSKKMWLHRAICEEAFVNYSQFRRGELDDEQRRRVRQATQILTEMPLYVDDASGMRIADMRVKLNTLMRESPVDLIVVDYAQLIRPPKGVRFANENDKFTLIGEEIKILTKSTGIPMLLLSQLNRESEKEKGDNKPKLSQCRGAGIWEEISFVGATLYREWLRKRDRDDLRERIELLVEKNRSGPAKTIDMRIIPWLMRITNIESNRPETPVEPPAETPAEVPASQ